MVFGAAEGGILKQYIAIPDEFVISVPTTEMVAPVVVFAGLSISKETNMAPTGLYEAYKTSAVKFIHSKGTKLPPGLSFPCPLFFVNTSMEAVEACTETCGNKR